jgi:hypothetical protein
MHRDYLTELAHAAGYSTDWNFYTVAAIQHPALISAWLRAAALIAHAHAEQDLHREVVAWLFEMAEDQRRSREHDPLTDTATDILIWTHRLREAAALERSARSAFTHHCKRLADDEDFLGPTTPAGDDHGIQPAG